MNFYTEFDTRRAFPDAEDQQFLIARLFQGLHKAIVQECGEGASNQAVLAACFPMLCAEKQTAGPVMRVFSHDRQVLERMLRNGAVHRFAKELGPVIAKTPPSLLHERFKRNRSDNATSLSGWRRMVRRAAAAGRPAPQRATGNPIRGLAKIEMTSESNGQSFAMFINRESAHHMENGRFNAYGLSISGTIPSF